MNWTTANMELDNNQTQIRGTNMNDLTVRGGNLFYKSIKTKYKYNFDCYSIISFFFRSLPYGESLTLYSSIWAILILHLLII